jgi:hypothetical protein
MPDDDGDIEGYEAATGAALLAEGLVQDGLAAEVRDWLQIRGASGDEPTRLVHA